MGKEGLLTQLPKDVDELADHLLVTRGKLTFKLESFRTNSQALDQLEQAINFIGRYQQQNGAVEMAEVKSALEEALQEHLVKEARFTTNLPHISLLEDAIQILEAQEITLGKFSDFWRSGTKEDAAMLAIRLKEHRDEQKNR